MYANDDHDASKVVVRARAERVMNAIDSISRRRPASARKITRMAWRPGESPLKEDAVKKILADLIGRKLVSCREAHAPEGTHTVYELTALGQASVRPAHQSARSDS